jgi:DNA damage-binding protein 1
MQIDDGAKAQVSEGEMQLDILNTYTNLAPIVDFCLVETDDGKGPSHIVTCSGGKDDGTLRVVRHGVGLTELAALDMEGIQRVWTLSSTGDQA